MQKITFRGHGTYEEGGDLKASVAGVKEQVNKLVSVRPLKSRYNGQVGEVLVGRIMEVTQKRWKVDTNSRLDSALLLSSVNLPGGELVGMNLSILMTLVETSIGILEEEISRRPTHDERVLAGRRFN